MFRPFGFMLFVSLLSVAAVQGQEIPPEEAQQLQTQWTLEKIENPPARTIKFMTTDEPLQIRLKRIAPDLLAQQFAAQINLAMHRLDAPDEFSPITYWPASDGPRFFFYRGTGRPRPDDYAPTLAGVFERLVQQIPADHRPTEKQLSFFLNTKLEEGYLRFQFASLSQAEVRRLKADELRIVTILAPTAELAQERAQTFLKLVDWGLARPIQRAKWNERFTLLENYPKAIANIAESKAEYARLQKEYAEVKEFTDDLRPGVKVQLAEADADLADATARAAECEKLLADPALGPAGKQQIRSLQLSLRVEIKGLTARRETLAKYIDNLATASRLRKSVNTAAEAQQFAAFRPKDNLKTAIAATRDVENLALQVVDDTVQIQPVKWEP